VGDGTDESRTEAARARFKEVSRVGIEPVRQARRAEPTCLRITQKPQKLRSTSNGLSALDEAAGAASRGDGSAGEKGPACLVNV